MPQLKPPNQTNKMEKLLLSVVLLATCSAKVEDLSGRVFVFPRETAVDHVKLLTPKQLFESSTVCLRFLTDLTRSYGLFSLSSSEHSNAFLLFKPDSEESIEMAIRDTSMFFRSLSLPQNTWHSMCATWNRDSGVAQLWVDGKPSVRRYIATGSISGAPITILGQEQDSYGGDFDKAQSFVGMISHVHMWDYIVPPHMIRHYAAGEQFTPGTVFNWRALDFEIVGKVSIEDQSTVM